MDCQIPMTEKIIRRLLTDVHYYLPWILLIMCKGSVPCNFMPLPTTQFASRPSHSLLTSLKRRATFSKMTIFQTVVALGFVASASTLPAPTPAQTANSFYSATQAAPASGIITMAPDLAYSSTVMGG
jgi:hypothetical protein